LEKNWKNTFRLFGIDRHAKFITNGRLERIVEGNDPDYWAKEDYDLVLVDEAHRYRNHKSQAFGLLQRICKAPRNNEGLVPGKKKKVILISATPLNNRPQDLYYQLLLFQDARRSTLSVTNLQNFFGPIIRKFTEIMRQDKPDIQRIRGLYSTVREKIISQITVRRTRRDLKKYPKYIDDIKAQGIEFPDIAPPIPKMYQLGAKLSKNFYHTVFYLTDIDKIQYYRYQAIRYLKSDLRENYYEQAVLVSQSLAGIMKTVMIKRLESSFTAFKLSLKNLTTATKRMIEMFENGKVLIAPDLKLNDLMEKGVSIEDLERLVLESSIENPRNNIFKPDDFEGDFIEGLKKDYLLLQELVKIWDNIEQDPKLDTFLASLKDELLSQQKNPTGKLVIFTESADTADYLTEKVETFLGTKILNISSDNRNKLFDIIQENFDANHTGDKKSDYNIIITTDVLAEGVNLHRANVIVNYDTPWNATRLMQRIGRVNRIGSVAGVIYNYNFYPSQQGDEEIKLYSKALIKMQGFHTAFGEDAQIFTHEELLEQFELFKEGLPDDEDERLEYLRVIRDFKDNHPKEYKRIKSFPLKARTARNIKYVAKENTENSTIVFLRSPYKMDFYQITDKKEVNPLTFLEAAKIFKASTGEPAFPLPQYHYEQVQAALKAFENDFLGAVIEKVTTTDKADANTKQALKFLRDFKALTHHTEVKEICQTLQPIVENGTFTPLANELKKLSQRFFSKKEITASQVENLLVALAKKYDVIVDSEEEEHILKEIDANIEPEIILSETFIK